MVMIVCAQASRSVGQPSAPSAASRGMRLIPVSDDGYRFECMTCAPCAQTVAIGFLERAMCDTRFFDAERGPPCVNILANAETRKLIHAARLVYDGIAKTSTLAANY